MSRTDRLDIAIVVAGIGGLTAAADLLKQEHSVHVFEQSPEFGEIGAGIKNGSRNMASLYHSRNEIELCHKFIRQDLSSAFGEWLYGYDPLTVPLTAAQA